MKKIFTLLVITLTGVINIPSLQAQVNTQDSLALVDLYNATNGAGWHDKTFWLSTQPLDDWYGVTVVGTRVTKLKLDVNTLKGTLPASIGNVTGLRFLDLSGNQLTGSIPSSITNLITLTRLSLSFNQFSGGLPTAIGSMVSLDTLDLKTNQLTGSLPASIVNMPSVTWLNLSHNQFSGALPALIGNLITLKTIDLSYNKFTGSLPTSIGSLVSLKSLHFEQNSFSGALPATIGGMVNLNLLYLDDCAFTGNLPTEIGNLLNLTVCSLNNNKFAGSIPSSFGNLVNLTKLWLYHNKLTGSIPASLGNLVLADGFQLNDNLLTGPIPSSIGNLAAVTNLFLFNNQLSGAIPSSIGNLSSVISLRLENNLLSDSIPSSIGNLSTMGLLRLNNNQLTGPIPSAIGNLIHITSLYLNNNQLSGSIPASLSNIAPIFGQPPLIDLSSNQLTGNFPASFVGFKANLFVSHNKLSGTVPDLSSMQSLDIRDNKFTFDGIESLSTTLVSFNYAPQAIIPLHYTGSVLSVSAGGTLSNNTYHWYEDNTLVATITGDSTYAAAGTGYFHVSVTNAVATKLTLLSDSVSGHVLPVRFISFAGNLHGSNVTLQWKTGQEQNTARFDVLRSGDGVTFNTIAQVAAAGNSNAVKSYAYNDNIAKVPTQKLYYRIDEVDKDGKKQQSNVVLIDLNNVNKAFLVYPNPAKNSIHIQLNNGATITITNATGKVVLVKTVAAGGDVNISSLPGGVYYVKNNATGETKKIVKQ